MANPEVNKPIPLSEIPQHWEFKERNGPIAIDLVQVEPREGYLAFNLNFGRNDMPNTSVDYFFDQKGEPMTRRFSSSSSSLISYLRENSEIEFEAHSSLVLYMRNHLNVPGDIYDFISDNVTYDSGKLIRVTIGDFMLKGRVMQLPRLSMDPTLEEKTFKLYKTPFTIKEENNEVFFINPKGEKEFLTNWKIESQEDAGGKEFPFIVVTQMHIPTGDKKILTTPLQADMKKIIDIMQGRFPYKRNNEGKLDIPWADLDRQVGFGVGYLRSKPLF